MSEEVPGRVTLRGSPASAETPPYIGRFAPSPTGPLHFGSLLAAVASYLDARANLGSWLLRIEDVDEMRSVSGAADAIRTSLLNHGLIADAELPVQSQRSEHYRQALEQLIQAGAAFYCTCSRSRLAGHGGIYPGHCRACRQRPAGAWAARLAVPRQVIGFRDAVQGPFQQNLADEVGDFVIWRKEGYAAYQLAVVVDDADQGITHVVRGADLLDNTPRQLWLQTCLGFPSPRYAHIPVVANASGQKLSKQSFAKPLDAARPVENLARALAVLRQPLPPRLNLSPAELLAWSAEQWDLTAIPALPRLLPADLPAAARAFAT